MKSSGALNSPLAFKKFGFVPSICAFEEFPKVPLAPVVPVTPAV